MRSNNRSLIVSRLKDIGITDVKTVVRDSTKYRFLLATTSEIVTDDALPPYFIKKKEQKLTVLCHDLCNRKKGRSCLNEANDLGLIQKTLLEADELKFTDEVNERSVKHEFMISFLAGDRTEITPNVYYAGDLTRPENCFLIEEVLRKGKTDESDNKHVVILFEKSIRPAVSEFIKKYNQKAEFIQITAEGAVSFMDRVWQNLYRNHGWFRKKAEQLYVREYRRNFRVIDRKSLSVNVVNTDLYERIEELLLCNSKKVFHRIPPLFYRQLTDVFVARPEKLEQIADRFDEKIAYDIEFANKIWKDVPCTGIYLKPSKIKISSDFDNIYLKMKLKIATPKGEKIMEPDGSFIIGSTIHEK
ncbi:MAG: hypothetical protein Q4A40_02185, partial [Bacillota bacterium]|nr:hypothetical protein [Bacillota bacterium]